MRPKAIITAAAALLIVTSCSSDDDTGSETTSTSTSETTPSPDPTDAPESTDAPEATDAPEPTDAPAATDAPEPTDAPESDDLPVTPAVAVLANAYDFQGGTPDPDLLPAQPGEVEAHWYRAGDTLAVVYVGLDATVDACPGNSALLGTGFDFVSNAELPNGSCPDFPTRIENSATQGVQICDAQVGYLTLIPSDTVGQLFASLEKPVAEVQGVGLTAAIELADPTVLPEIDPASLAC